MGGETPGPGVGTAPAAARVRGNRRPRREPNRRLLYAGAVAILASSIIPWPASAATTVLSHQASSSGFPVGIAVFDFATLSGGANPTGTITYTLFGPNNATCAGPPIFTTTKTVSGNGNYQSDSFTTNQAGTYQWIAAYSGDANNTAAGTVCNDPAGQVIVAKRTPTFSDQASPPTAGAITATATLGNGAGPAGPTGTIIWDLFGPSNLVCSGPPIFTSSKAVAGNGNYTSDPFTPTAAGTYQWVARYSGDVNNNIGATTCADPAGSVVVTPSLITPTVTTVASPGVSLGGQVTDTATISGGVNPTGTMTFRLYGPNDATCAGTPAFTSTKTVTGPGSQTSDPFTPTAAGTYRWRATYSGDVAHNAVTTACNDPAETVVVSGGTTTPTLVTTASPSVALGGQVTDTATLSGGVNPTGTISFTLFGPNDATCASAAAFTSTKPVAGNGTYTSDPFTATAAGTYRWRASYSGDANNVALSTACNDPNESVVVSAASQVSITAAASPASIPTGGQTTDTATLSGGTNPTGTVTFHVFGPNNPTCTGTPVFTSTKPVAGNGTYSSDPFTPTLAGTYHWVAAYSGDGNHAPAATACGDPNQTVQVAGSPVLPSLTTAASPAVTVGGQVTDTATLSGGNNPTGTITFTLFGPNNATCAAPAAFTSTVPVSGNAQYTSGPFTPTAAGTYRWVAAYSGDANNLAMSTACNDPSESVTVTAAPVAGMTVAKTASPASRPEPGGAFQYGVTITNTGNQPITLTGLTDNVYGNVSQQGTCTNAVGTILQPGAAYSCQFSGSFTGNAGATQTDVVTATGTTPAGATVTASDDATVTVTDAVPVVGVNKTASPAQLPAPGGQVTFSVTVSNPGSEPVNITALTDNVYGNVAQQGTCTTAVGTVVPGGGTYSCQFTGTFNPGVGGGTQVSTVTVTVRDDEGNTAMASDSANVTVLAALPVVAVDKTATPATRPEPGGPFTFTITVTNLGVAPVTITSLTDSVYGNIAQQGTCTTAVGAVIAPNGTYSCQFTSTFSGNAGATQTDTVTVTVIDPAGATATATDAHTIAITNVVPMIVVDKSVSPPSRPEPGGSFTFSITVVNASTEPLVLTSLVDSVHGNLNGRGTCAVGATLAPGGGVYACSFTATFFGNAGATETDTVTATAVDDEGGAATASDIATIQIVDVPPAAVVTNAVDPSSLPEQGGTFTHTVTVTNVGAESVRITSLVDDVYGDLPTRPGSTCGTAPGAVLATGASYTCTFTATFTGEAGASLTDTVRVTVIDDDGTVVTASDGATVRLTDVPPKVDVAVAASPQTRPEPGGAFTYTVTVRNLSNPETVVITSLRSDVHGDLNGRGTCRTGITLPPPPSAGSVYTCTFTATFTGNAGSAQVTRITVTVVDNEGTPATATSAPAGGTVTLTDVPPTVAVTKSAGQQAVAAPGGVVIFTVTVTNTSFEPVRLVQLTDDVFGDLHGRGSCLTGGVLLPGATFRCTFAGTVAGAAGFRHTDLVTATVLDDDGSRGQGRAIATVAIVPLTAVIPAPPPAPGAPVAPAPAPASIAFTGSNTQRPAAVATALVALGFALVALVWRRSAPSR